MPAVTRHGDICTGHSCFPPRPSISGSGNVFVNNIALHRVGDSWAHHSCPNTPSHGGNLASGSATVFANGKGVGRIGDPISCGSFVATGSSNVYVG